MEKIKDFLVSRKIYIACLLVLLAPFVYNGFIHQHDIVLESSVFSVNYNKYFTDLIHYRSNFFTGQYSIQLASYAALYALLWAAGALIGSGAGYFLIVGLLFWFGYHFLAKLLGVIGKAVSPAGESNLAIRCLLALLFFTSLAMFNFMKSNIIFLLPYLLLPAILYWAVRYLEQAKIKYLLYLLLVLVLATTFNLTHLILVLGFTIVFLIIYNSTVLRLTRLEVTKRILPIGATFLPPLIVLATITATNSVYGGSASEFASAVSENFYSLGAKYLNIFQQTTDWGLFGSWRGVPYYVFSHFYERPEAMIFGILPYLTLVAAYAFLPKKGNISFLVALLAVLVVIFQFMLGFHNPLYRYLYDNLFGFQIFRNITKAAPLLYLSLVISLYVLVLPNMNRLLKVGLCLLLLLAMLYNLPYWAYAGRFFTDRTVKEVPTYWQETADYLNSNLSANDKVLVLPATYILEQYSWPEGQRNIQGHLLDSLLDNRLQSYRLGEILIGPAEMQKDMGALYLPSERSIRKLDVNYPKLSDFARKYGLDYVVVSQDLVSEYQHQNDIELWLAQNGYKQRVSFDKVAVYSNPDFRVKTDNNVELTRVDNSNWLITVKNLKVEKTINKLPYGTGWSLFPDSVNSQNGSQLRSSKKVFDSSHEVGAGYENRWKITANEVKSLLPKESYSANADGSLNVYLRAQFMPQNRFHLGLIAATGVFGLILLGMACAVARKKYLFRRSQ